MLSEADEAKLLGTEKERLMAELLRLTEAATGAATVSQLLELLEERGRLMSQVSQIDSRISQLRLELPAGLSESLTRCAGALSELNDALLALTTARRNLLLDRLLGRSGRRI